MPILFIFKYFLNDYQPKVLCLTAQKRTLKTKTQNVQIWAKRPYDKKFQNPYLMLKKVAKIKKFK